MIQFDIVGRNKKLLDKKKAETLKNNSKKAIFAGSNLIRKKNDWSESKKVTKVVALRDKKKNKTLRKLFLWIQNGSEFF